MIGMTKKLVIGCLLAQGLTLARAATIDFNRDIRPILTSHCTECHGGVKAAGGVSFVYKEQVIGFVSDSGRQVVQPGNPQQSELFLRVSTTDPEDRMPPAGDHEPLTSSEINLLRNWIQEGGIWSGHWAFEKPVASPPPTSPWPNQVRNDIDRFLHARLTQEGLSPSPMAEPGHLLRRLTLALNGLPPTLEELDAFETAFQKSPTAAVDATVEDLLSRPTFGERWASMWLDLVRYADSRGLGLDGRRNIWPYRDWVVRAFNQDLPFDQFTLLQLAGDLLPQPTLDARIATACHRNTATNDEGGTDDEAFRVEAQVDRVNSTWQIWGATTFGCVQCHDHPYDPFRHAEYYQFMDFFNSTADSDLPDDGPLVRVPLDMKDPASFVELEQRILNLLEDLWKPARAFAESTSWIRGKSLQPSSNNGTVYVVETTPDGEEFHTEGTVQTGTAILVTSEAPSDPIQAIRLTVKPLHPETALADSEWGFVIHKLHAWIVDANGKKTEIPMARSVADVAWMPNDPYRVLSPEGIGFGADTRIYRTRDIVLLPKEPISVPEGGRLSLQVECNKTGHGHPMIIKRGHVAFSTAPEWSQFLPTQPDIQTKLESLQSARKERDRHKTLGIPVMLERPNSLRRSTHVFTRGNFMAKGAEVHAALPASLTTSSTPSSPNRLDMARWWISKDNPLTARVLVNRLWEQIFGIGIVPTLEDFGSSGEPPTHPELLDHLALQFQHEFHWSIKSMIREMVTSAAFLQSARVSPEALEKDPGNRFLARAPRFRLPAEMVRDQALALAGLLSNEVGGPPVHPPIPDGVWQPFDAKDKWITPKPGDSERYRRSLYTYVKRSIPYPTFASFDAPSREFCTPRRLSSNTPLQALVTLNDTAFVECAQALGKQLRALEGKTNREKLAQGFRQVTARRADEHRLNTLESLLHEAGDTDAGWTLVGQVLLNLDENLNF